MASIVRRGSLLSLASASVVAGIVAATACSDVTVTPLATPDAAADATIPGSDSATIDTGGGDDAATTVDAAAAAAGDASAVDAAPDAGAPDAAPAPPTDASPGDASDAADASSLRVDAGPPTFTNVYTSIIAAQCVACHGQKPPLGGSNLYMGTQSEAFTNLVNVAAAGSACGGQLTTDGGTLLRVSPGNAAGSLLYEKVAGTQPCGSQMPLNQGALDPSLVGLVSAWIAAGAPND